MKRGNLLAWLARIWLALQFLWLPHLANAAAYAQDGIGKYKNEILWLTWGGDASQPNGVDGVNLGNGATSVANLPVANGVNLQVSCTLQNPTNPVTSYRPGNYTQGDRLDRLYRIGGTGRNNQLVSGIVNRDNGQTASFDVTCSSKIGSQNIDLRGFVIADAESMAVGEYIESEAQGDWRVIETYKDPNAPDGYRVTKAAASNQRTRIRIDSTRGDGLRSVVTFLKFSNPAPTQTMNFTIKGNGKTAIAIGVVVPYADFGDAPASYGDAMHLIDDINVSSDSIALNVATDVAASTYVPATFIPPGNNYLGTRGPDTEPGTQASLRADGDDINGAFADEENAWPPTLKQLNVLQAGKPLTATDIACKGSGSVTGWIDFNLNGVFDATEKALPAACINDRVTLTWNIPADMKSTAPGAYSYVRLRYSTNQNQVQTPIGVAQDGEVEDHSITIVAPQLAISKSSNAGSNGWTIGQADAKYLLTVSNRGVVATGPGPAQVSKPLKVFDELPVGIVPNWSGTLTSNGWSCTYAGQRITCLSNNHLAATGQAGSQSVIEFPVSVQAAAASGQPLVNFASVGGGMDPNNSGEPPSPANCTQQYYCASTPVVVKRPAVAVAKTANPSNKSKVAVGDIITYTLQVTVADAATLSPVVLTDTLGQGLEFAAVTSNAPGFAFGNSGQVLTFTLPSGKSAGVYSVSYQARVTANAVTQVNNKVIPSGGGDPGGPPPSCTNNCSTSHSLDSPVIAVVKSSDPVSGAEVKAGQVITYTLIATVSRSQTLSDVVLKDTLGADLTFGAVIGNAGGYVLSGSGNQRTFTLPAGKVPGSYSVTYTAVVNANAKQGGDIRNLVVPSGGTTTGGPPPTCSSCSTNHVMAKPSVSYAKSTTGNSVRVGDEIDYKVVVKVSDAQTTAPVVISDTLGQGLQYVAGSAVGDLTVSSTNPLTLTLAAGKQPGTYSVTYRARVSNQASGTVVNRITGTGGGGNPPGCTPGASCDTSTPVVQSEVSYRKSTAAGQSAVKVGDEIEFTLHVDVRNSKNIGVVHLQDTLGQGLEFVRAQNNPNSWSVANNGKQIAVDVPAGQSVGSYTVSYVARVTADATGSVRNAVLGTGPDGPSCASSCSTETEVVKPEVSFNKSSSVASARVGDLIPYRVTVTVKNSALTQAYVSLVDNLGLGLEFVQVTSAGSFTYGLNGQTLELSLPKGTVPGTYSVEYQARVTPAAVSTVQNTVTGVPGPGGPTPQCDKICSVVTPVIREIDAVDDHLPDVKGYLGTTNAGNAYTNDTLNGNPVAVGDIVGKVVTPATPINGGTVPVLDTATGVVSVPPGTPAGDYVITYQICDKKVTTLCDTARITIRVTASPIDAKDDSYVANRGTPTEQVVGNAYSENDTLNGVGFTPELINGQVLTPASPIGGNPAVPVLNIVTGSVTVPPGTPAGEYYISYRICERINPSNCDDAIVKVVIKPDESLLRIVKTAAVRTVKIGDLVRYSLQVENIGAVKVVNANIIDTAATGFTYVAGTLNATGLGSSVTASGVRPVQFSGITLDVGQSGTISYMTRVGAGVRPGNHVNSAVARNGVGDNISNVATATVQLTDDPLLDESLIFGTVFDDRDRDGWQDSAAISGLFAKGGFAPQAYVANSTTVDRGAGPEPVADASAPLLHGLDLGRISARQSQADPVDKHMVVIRQKLRSLDFTDDFVLTNEQGVTVRMDAAGRTTVEKSGEAAAGRNAAAIEVERRVTPEADGFGVVYVLRSTGIDERGIPGVRIASVEGLLIETDLFGRYHLAGINGGRWERGRHFILKVDPTTLPAGAEFTTSNPLLRRITPGVPVRFDFGVNLNPEFMAGGRKTVEIELGSVLFAAGSTELRSQYLPVIAKVADKVREYGGGDLLISADGESEAVAFGRAEAVRQALAGSLDKDLLAATTVSVRTRIHDADGLVSGVTGAGAVLGTVLFETDKAVVRPAYQELLAKVAAYLNRQGGGVVSIVGHTDVRASHAYNQKLGMQRAKAVYQALLPHLSEQVKQRVEVVPRMGTGPDSPVQAAKPGPATGSVKQDPSN